MPPIATTPLPSPSMARMCRVLSPRPLVPGAIVGVAGLAAWQDGAVVITAPGLAIVGGEGGLIRARLSTILSDPSARAPDDVLLAYGLLCEGQDGFLLSGALPCGWQDQAPNSPPDWRSLFVLPTGILLLDGARTILSSTTATELAHRSAIWVQPPASAHDALAIAGGTHPLCVAAQRSLRAFFPHLLWEHPEPGVRTPL